MFRSVKTNQLICNTGQLTGFYMREALAGDGLKFSKIVK